MNEIKKETALAKSEKIVALTADFGKVYVKIQPDGQVMAPVRADMTLFEKLGHIYRQKDKYLVTATGYKYLNKVASISIVTPQSVIVDGRPVPNPHIERNPRTKAIESVNIRKMGIGYSPAGNIVVIDKTLFYNVYTYFIQAVQAKMGRVKWTTTEQGKSQKTNQKEFPNCAIYGVADEKPTLEGRWAFYPTEEPLGIWINYEDQAIIDCLEEHTQRQRFGDRMATTIVERNILKDHPAIAVSQVFEKSSPGGMQATVTVHGWRNDNSPRHISETMRLADSGAASAAFEIQAEVIAEVDLEEEKAIRKEVVETEGVVAEPEALSNPAKDKEPPASFFDKQREQARAKVSK